jgi:hypothetical protein
VCVEGTETERMGCKNENADDNKGDEKCDV